MIWDKQSIQDLLDRNDEAVCRAIVTIYNLQTAEEQESHTTNNLNGVGFNGRDAEFGSSLAEKINKGWAMSPKQISAGRRMIKKYWRQLAEVANERQVA